MSGNYDNQEHLIPSETTEKETDKKWLNLGKVNVFGCCLTFPVICLPRNCDN